MPENFNSRIKIEVQNKILGDDLKQNEPEREPHKGQPKDGSTFGGEICPSGGEIFKYIRQKETQREPRIGPRKTVTIFVGQNLTTRPITYFKGMQYSEVRFHATQIFGILYWLKLLDV